MMLSDIDFHGKLFLKDDLNMQISLADQIWQLNQDILYVEYENEITLDLGWSNEFEIDGYFVINVISEKGWESPILYMEVKFDKLLSNLKGVIEFCRSRSKMLL